jgi:hypothetical protein
MNRTGVLMTFLPEEGSIASCQNTISYVPHITDTVQHNGFKQFSFFVTGILEDHVIKLRNLIIL